MRKMWTLVLTSLTALVLVATIAAPAGASHSWGGYHWARKANPFTVKIGDNVTGSWDSYFSTAVGDWSQSSVLDLAPVAGLSKGNCKATSGRIEVCAKAYGYNGWLGLARIWISGKHITAGTVQVNDSYFALAAYNNPDEKLHVMCQEIGHTLGLGHTSEDGSTQNTCMDYSNSPTSTRPNSHDYSQLASIYSHLDSTTTIDSSARASGRATRHERELSNGDVLVTFIYHA